VNGQLATSQLVRGELQLRFAYHKHRQRTDLISSAQRMPLQVIRAFPLDDSGALVHVHNLSGGVLGGDQLSMNVEVGNAAHVQLTTTSATRLYRHRAHLPPARQTNHLAVKEDALLEYLPDQLIPFAGSRYQQHTLIELAEGASLFWWEVVAPGRVAKDELFEYDLLSMKTEIRARNQPVAIEQATLEPHLRRLTSFSKLADYPYFCSFYICKVGLEAARWEDLENELQVLARQHSHKHETYWGVSTLIAEGLVIKGVSTQGRNLPSGLYAFWQAAKMSLHGQMAKLPRKVY
jgi:urease accessory protein